MKKTIMPLVLLSAICLSGAVSASGSHEHSHGHDESKKEQATHDHASHDAMNHSAMFLVEKKIGDYTVSFHVMDAKPGMEHGGKQNLMIKIEEGDKVLQNVKINSKVVYPNGSSDSKALMRMDDWYMNGYDLNAKGEHQLMIMFKTADGEVHKGGVYYQR